MPSDFSPNRWWLRVPERVRDRVPDTQKENIGLHTSPEAASQVQGGTWARLPASGQTCALKGSRPRLCLISSREAGAKSILFSTDQALSKCTVVE